MTAHTITETPNSRYELFIASCIPAGGIYRFVSDGNSFEQVGVIPCDSPMYIFSECDKLFVTLRDAGEDHSSVISGYKYSRRGYTKIGADISTAGKIGCHLTRYKGKAYVTNYLSGSVFCSSGKLDMHCGHGINMRRQEAPHPHFIAPAPDNECLLSADLGLDAVFVYDEELNVLSVGRVPNGHGARHLAYSTDGGTVFCVNELASTVSVFRYGNRDLTFMETVPALRKSSADNTSAAIRVNGNYVYVSNRGNDSISCLRWDGNTLQLETESACGGRSPRDFVIIDDTIFCANELSDTVSVLKVNGCEIFDTGKRLHVDKPLCVVASRV